VTSPYRRPIRFWGAAPPVCQSNNNILNRNLSRVFNLVAKGRIYLFKNRGDTDLIEEN